MCPLLSGLYIRAYHERGSLEGKKCVFNVLHLATYVSAYISFVQACGHGGRSLLTIRGRLIIPFILGSMSVGLNILIRHSFTDL